MGGWVEGDLVKGLIREFVEVERVGEGGGGGEGDRWGVLDVGRDVKGYLGEVEGCGCGKV